MIRAKMLMTATAAILGIAGLILTFFPHEAAGMLTGARGADAIVFQVMGAMYFGFAMLNWMARANLMGGIYGRPLALGNFSHFAVAALALIKLAFIAPPGLMMLTVTVLYSALALLFGYVVFTHPAAELKRRAEGIKN